MKYFITFSLLFFIGCSTAVVQQDKKQDVKAIRPTSNYLVNDSLNISLAQLPNGPSPRGWVVEFHGGPLDRQVGVIPRDYTVKLPYMYGRTGDFGARYHVDLTIGPSSSKLNSIFSFDNSSYEYSFGSINSFGQSFNGTGIWETSNAPDSGFSAIVTAIP